MPGTLNTVVPPLTYPAGLTFSSTDAWLAHSSMWQVLGQKTGAVKMLAHIRIIRSQANNRFKAVVQDNIDWQTSKQTLCDSQNMSLRQNNCVWHLSRNGLGQNDYGPVVVTFGPHEASAQERQCHTKRNIKQDNSFIKPCNDGRQNCGRQDIFNYDSEYGGTCGSSKHHNHRNYSPRYIGLCVVGAVQCLTARAEDDQSMAWVWEATQRRTRSKNTYQHNEHHGHSRGHSYTTNL